jgi:hypothetical protein
MIGMAMQKQVVRKKKNGNIIGEGRGLEMRMIVVVAGLKRTRTG